MHINLQWLYVYLCVYIYTYTYIVIKHIFIEHLFSVTQFARCWYVYISQSVSVDLDLFSKNIHFLVISQ